MRTARDGRVPLAFSRSAWSSTANAAMRRRRIRPALRRMRERFSDGTTRDRERCAIARDGDGAPYDTVPYTCPQACPVTAEFSWSQSR